MKLTLAALLHLRLNPVVASAAAHEVASVRALAVHLTHSPSSAQGAGGLVVVAVVRGLLDEDHVVGGGDLGVPAVFIIHWHNEIQFLYNSTCALWRSFNSGNILFCQVQADLCAAQFSKRLSAIKMFIFSSPAARHFMLFRLKLVDHFPP